MIRLWAGISERTRFAPRLEMQGAVSPHCSGKRLAESIYSNFRLDTKGRPAP